MWLRPSHDDAEETRQIAEWMRALASIPSSDAPLPDPSYLWWKAELLRRWHAEERTVVALDAVEQVQIAVGIVCAALLLVLAWRNLGTLIQDPGTTVVAGIVGSAVVLAAAAVA